MADGKNINHALAVNRESLTTNLLERYKKSKRLVENRAPIAVDFLANTFARGFTIKQSGTAINLDKTSSFKQGFNNTKYKG